MENRKFAFTNCRVATFSSLNNKDDNQKDYRSKFEDLIGKASTPLSKDEQEMVNREVEAKRQLDEESARKIEQAKQDKAEQNVKDFEKLSKGE
jgi:hypothetical protein